MVFSLCGCSLVSEMNPTQVTRESVNVFHLALDQDIVTPDVQAGGSVEIASNIYSRLLKFRNLDDGSSVIEGDLAESWDVSSDGLSYTFHLREGVLFHNDEEFEADDVLFTVDRMLKNEKGTASNDTVLKVLGAYDVLYGVKESVENIGVTVIDKYTVVITLNEAWAPFLSAICDTSWSIYNRDAKETGAYSIGTGPYVFDEWVADEYVFLKVYDYYYGGKASVDGVLYRILPLKSEQLAAFNNGELDAISVKGEEGLVNSYLNDEICSSYVVAKKEFNSYFYAMNQNLTPFTEQKVRTAIQKILDRKALLSEVFNGQGQLLNGILPPGMIAYNQALPRIKTNLAEAQELIAEAGFTEGFSLTVCQTGTNEKENLINQLTAEQLSNFGINANVRTMDQAAYYSALTSGNIPMHLCCITTEFNDPDAIIGKVFGSIENVRYSMNIGDGEVLQRIENASFIINMDQRVKEYRDIEERLVDINAAIIPLFSIYSYVLVNPRVGEFDSSDCVYNFTLNIQE